MSKWLIFFLLVGLIVLPSIAGAQGGTKLDSLNIELWSEYDKPSMLVINRFVVSQDTPLPASVTLRFPKEGNLYAVALEKNGEPFYKDFDPPIEQGDWQTVTIKVESYDPHRIEYYQPLTWDGNKREFKYQWFGDYYVKEFNLTVLLPADSTELITSPVLESTTLSENGLVKSGIVTKNDMKMGNSFNSTCNISEHPQHLPIRRRLVRCNLQNLWGKIHRGAFPLQICHGSSVGLGWH